MSGEAAVRAIAAILRKRRGGDRQSDYSTYRKQRGIQQFHIVHEWGEGEWMLSRIRTVTAGCRFKVGNPEGLGII